MAFCGFIAALLLVGLTESARPDDKPADNLSPEQIFKKVQATYDSMTSYSDKGKTVALDSDIRYEKFNAFITFTTKLARPGLYRIEWEYIDDVSRTSTKKDTLSAWSAGEGDFWDIGKGAEKQKSQSWTLLRRGGHSGGATLTIPGIFFKMHWSHLLEEFGAYGKREADEKVADIDCYVFFKDDQVKQTLWIGKQDYLIHQFRTVSTGQSNVTSTETHSDIAINQKFLPKDFTP